MQDTSVTIADAPILAFEGPIAIVGGGAVDPGLLVALHRRGVVLIGADGGADAIGAVGLVPAAIIGDLDSLYDREGWSGKTPADVSALVHELVHHLQNVAGMKFGCPQEREKDAYEAQRAWLALFDRTLEQEFEINPLMVLARTNCMF